MNLHNLVGGVVASVNPWITVAIQPSTGYTTNADGTRSPSYGATVYMSAQRQSLSYQDLIQTQGLNIQGTRCVLYINGSYPGVVRADGQGGDIVTLPDGTVWLVAMVLEDWVINDGWSKIICTLQDNA